MQVLKRADELAARVRQDPTGEAAHGALLAHLDQHAASRVELLPLVREELARLGLEPGLGSDKPGDRGLSSTEPLSRQHGRPAGACAEFCLSCQYQIQQAEMSLLGNRLPFYSETSKKWV